MTGLSCVLLLAVVLGYALVSDRLSRTSITGPMIFVAAGLLITPLETGATSGHGVGAFLEIALAMVLFTDALSIDMPALRKEIFRPGRLLGIGLPLTIVVGLGVALLMLDVLEFWEAAVVGVVLAPMDAALGQAAIANPRVPLLTRQGVSVESGLNDGTAVPLHSVFVVQGQISVGIEPSEELGRVFLEEIGLGIVPGLVVGWVGGKLLVRSSENGWIGPVWRGLLCQPSPFCRSSLRQKSAEAGSLLLSWQD